jgi:hypothetical protein
MKRSLLPASALVLVVTACGAGAKPAPRATVVRARVPSVRVLVAEHKRAAAREARRVLRRFVPPPGARSAHEPRGYGGVLRRTGPTPAGEVVDVHRFWSVRKPLTAVAAFLRTHKPHGFGGGSAGHGPSVPRYVTWSFSTRTRDLNVTAVALPGRTVIRVDTQVLWIYPRSPAEKVPPAAREMVLSSAKSRQKVTDPAQVGQIISWFDALPISPPGVALLCPLEPGAAITLSFRSSAGAWLAQVKLPSRPASICDAIVFQVGGKAKKPLIDRNFGESFVVRLQRLLGVRLVRTHR